MVNPPSLAPPTAGVSSRKRKANGTKSLSPEEYAKAVLGYSLLPTGAGQNHTSLADFLTNESTAPLNCQPYLPHYVVALYPLGLDITDNDRASPGPGLPAVNLSPPPGQTKSPDSDIDADHDSADERRHESRRCTLFYDPHDLLRHDMGQQTKPLSSIVFLRGYMTAAWINAVGARFVVDPEFFCRHLDFRQPDDSVNNFSTPALPSSSWHLIELPVITIGTRTRPKGPMQLDRIEELRKEGAQALAGHHDRIAKLSSSDMATGESMVRDFYVFDETHFAIEQRISICMQPAERGKSFSLIIWLDSGAAGGDDAGDNPPLPWSVQSPESRYLPVILHRHMIALKCHLLTVTSPGDTDPSARSAAHLPTDYGRSLRPGLMASDAFYSLTEVFSFAASSQMAFLNLIDAKLDKHTSLPSAQDFQSLPNLRYTKRMLYRHMQKLQRVLDSIQNGTEHPKWPKDRDSSTTNKAAGIAAQSVQQDFKHLLGRAEALHSRSTEAITVLMSSISISESQKAMEQAARVGRLTFLAFVFVPLSFTTSFFGMNVAEWQDGGLLGLKWWGVLSVVLTAAAVALFYVDVGTFSERLGRGLRELWRRGRTRWALVDAW
ncbi:hypothetical protein B0T19DRAFT_196272 [Cercophora scortea]|uniref:Uncharacterized protein n=1 Tax=Cercophora scortea TaxID=314031 RepID=A0AAE0MDP3_9PEZI|nr:hypothetical protein B0T19DRAFT_196272 [Cercophora scortea]